MKKKDSIQNLNSAIMPKKNWGENTKATEARARKAAVKAEERERKEKEADDKLWEDNDKHVLRKQERKEDKDEFFIHIPTQI